jgi:hypothetical protein
MRSLMKIDGKQIRVEGRLIRIARLDGDKYEFLRDPEAMLDGLRKSRARIDIFTFLQRLPETSPKYAYPMEWDNLAVLSVSTFDHWWTRQIDNKTRNMVRRGEKKAVQTREVPFDDVLLRGICEIYNECPIRGGKRFPHYGMNLDRARQYAGTHLDRSIFIGAFLGERMIGFAKLTSDQTRTQVGLIHIVSMVQHKDKAPTNALIAQTVRSCADRGICYLVYSNFSYGNKQRDSLSDFKKNNGFQKVDLPRYYMPFNLIGWVAFRLGLHHRLVDQVPESVLAKFRKLRSAWYNRKLQASMGPF